VSQLLYTAVAHKFLSAIVTQLVQSQLTEINQRDEFRNIQAPLATLLQSYNVVQAESGITGSSLKGRIEYQLFGQPE
jgi:hypothetical protein